LRFSLRTLSLNCQRNPQEALTNTSVPENIMNDKEFTLCDRMLAGLDETHPIIADITIDDVRIREHSNIHNFMTVHYTETRGPETFYRVALVYDFEDCVTIFGGKP
jgi:hypothetical protein